MEWMPGKFYKALEVNILKFFTYLRQLNVWALIWINAQSKVGMNQPGTKKKDVSLKPAEGLCRSLIVEMIIQKCQRW